MRFRPAYLGTVCHFPLVVHSREVRADYIERIPIATHALGKRLSDSFSGWKGDRSFQGGFHERQPRHDQHNSGSRSPTVGCHRKGLFVPAPAPVTVADPLKNHLSQSRLASVIGSVTYIMLLSKVPLLFNRSH